MCRLVNEVISFAAVVVTRRNEKARARGSDADGALVKAQYRVKNISHLIQGISRRTLRPGQLVSWRAGALVAAARVYSPAAGARA